MEYNELVEAKAKGVQVTTYDSTGRLSVLGQVYSLVWTDDWRQEREYTNAQIAVAIKTNSQAELLCPVCHAQLRGNVVESFHNVSLTVMDTWGNIGWDTADGEQTEAELVAMSCHECGYTVPEHYKVM